MKYNHEKMEMIRLKYFTGPNNDIFSRACLTADEICEEVFKQKGACYSSICIEKLNKSYIGKIITESEDMSLFWYLSSQRHHAKQDQKQKETRQTEGYLQVEDVKDFQDWNKAEIITNEQSIMGGVNTAKKQGRIEKHDNQFWFMPKGNKRKGYMLNRIDVQKYFIKSINNYS